MTRKHTMCIKTVLISFAAQLVVLVGCMLSIAVVSSAQGTYNISLDTASLIGHPAGPFVLAFQLTDGSGLGDGNNTVTATGFEFDSGGASGSPTVLGNATGSISSGITLRDSTFLSTFTQPFTPGRTLRFVITLSGNIDAGNVPDHFAFSILDRTGAALPTLGGVGLDVFLSIDVDSPMPSAQTFASDNAVTPNGGGGAIDTGVPGVDDTTPPVTNAAATGSAGGNGWYRGPVKITLTATDPDSPVSATYFGVDGAPTSTYGAPFIVANDGIHQISFYSVDPAGNQERVNQIAIKIDQTPPVISGMPAAGCTLWPPNQKLVTVATVTAADSLSGLAPGSFQLTGTSSEPASDPNSPDIVVSPNEVGGFVVQLRADRLGSGNGRIYTLNATANDLAGNTATVTAGCTVPHDQGK